MTTNILICLAAYLFYWIGKYQEGRSKHPITFRAGIFFLDNGYALITSLLGASISFFVLPVVIGDLPNAFTSFLAGWSGTSILKNLTKNFQRLL